MTDELNPNFESIDQLHALMNKRQKHFLTIGHWPLHGYAGMGLEIGIIYDVRTRQKKYQLDIIWTSHGLDLFGESYMGNYLYQFSKLEKLLDYLEKKYGIKVTDIPLAYQFDKEQFPNQLHNKEEAPIFEEAWNRFLTEFQAGKFLDPGPKLVYSTQDHVFLAKNPPTNEQS